MAGITFGVGSGVADSVFGKSQEAIRFIIEKRAEAFEEESVIKNIFVMDKSKHWAEKYTSMTAIDNFKPVSENGAYPVANWQEGYAKVLEPVTWKNSFSVTKEAIEDGKTIDLTKQPSAFTQSYYRVREMFGAALMGGAIKASANNIEFEGQKFAITTADGKKLFAGDHPAMVSGSAQRNYYSDSFSDDALAYAEAAMQGFKGDNGNILAMSPDTIIIPNYAPLKKAVFAAIGADRDPDTANNGFNYLFGRWRVIVWAYLNQFITANTMPWIIMDSRYNENHMGAIFTDRKELEVHSDIDPNTDANVWRGRARFTAGFNDWRAFLCAGISDAGAALIS